MFLGDNGSDAPAGGTHDIASSAPLRAKKGTHYEGGMRVPFIASWAKPDPENAFQKERPIPSGVINSTDIGVVYDVFTTVLDVAGGDYGDHVVDGIDLTPVFSSAKGSTSNREFLMHFPHSHRSSYFTAFRKGDWKLIYHYDKPSGPSDNKVELFNLSEDRNESINLAFSNPEKTRGNDASHEVSARRNRRAITALQRRWRASPPLSPVTPLHRLKFGKKPWRSCVTLFSPPNADSEVCDRFAHSFSWHVYASSVLCRQ